MTGAKEALKCKGKGKGKGKSEARYCYDCGEQGHIGVNCPYKWTIGRRGPKAPRGKVSLKEPRQKNSRAWRPDDEGEWCPEGTESPDGDSEWTQDQHFTTLRKMTRMTKCLED